MAKSTVRVGNKTPKEYIKVDDYWKLVIEPATPEESRRAEKRIREYHKDPSSFVPFKKRVTV
jgi:hypothetical protein